LLYLGDTARVPYGSRSPQTVLRYAERVAGHLLGRGIKALVVACNTATTWAIEALTETGRQRGIPVIGVIEPGVAQALATTRTGHVGVLGTEGTIRGGRYTALLQAARPDLQVSARACPLFVALAEEGWHDDPVAEAVAERYLAPLRGGPDTVILGCTHYPLLAPAIAAVLPGARLVDSAHATAIATRAMLARHGLLRPAETGGGQRFLVTDNLERFHRVGARFLGIDPAPTELVDLADDDHATWHDPGAGLRRGAL
ncbi:MAG: glutamate racemase, partial [Deltaproteobacteria bacterium]